jgi:hypothetical protein
MGYSTVCIEKYKLELIEILDEVIEHEPSLYSHIGVPLLFNWRAIFDFSSEAWSLFNSESRIKIINALAEKRTLFIALMTFKTMYIEMNRSDIAGAAGLSLARFLEDLIDPEFLLVKSQSDMSYSDNIH